MYTYIKKDKNTFSRKKFYENNTSIFTNVLNISLSQSSSLFSVPSPGVPPTYSEPASPPPSYHQTLYDGMDMENEDALARPKQIPHQLSLRATSNHVASMASLQTQGSDVQPRGNRSRGSSKRRSDTGVEETSTPQKQISTKHQ